MNFNFLKKKAASTRKIRLLDDETDFQITESYKTLRTNILFALPKSKCKKIMFTSAMQAEGKTTTCVNLAITLAQLGSKVLVVDCDMRKPRAHVYFKMKNEEGLSNIICDGTDVNEAIKRTRYDNLYFLPAGTITPNPSELLSSQECSDLFVYFEDYFEYVIIDTPPLSPVSDAQLVSKMADGSILVVRQNSTKMDQVSAMVESLQFIDSKILGFVLINVEKQGKYRFYKYHYAYE